MSHQIIGNSIKDQRKQLGMTQEKLAELIGVARVSVISIETGRHTPTIETALKLSMILGKSVEDLFWLKDVQK